MTIIAVVSPVDCGVVHVVLRGALSQASAVDVRRILRKCLAEDPTAVIVDVSGLSVDSQLQLTVFPAVMAAHSRPGAVLVLVSPTPAVRAMMGGWILRLVGVCDSAEQAAAVVGDHAVQKICRVDLPGEPTAPAQARAIATRYCEEHALGQATDSAVLVISELVSNAVRHARSAPHVRLAIGGPFLYVSVQDTSTRRPVLTDIDHLNVVPLPRRGRGLHLVDVHSSTWGSIPSKAGKTVWAAIRVMPAVARSSGR